MADARETFDHRIRKGINTIGGIAKSIGEEPPRVKVESLHWTGSDLGILLLNRRPQHIDVE